MESIGEIIRRQRKSKSMTQEELGRQVFVSKQAVSKWECGRTLPDIETLRRLAEILNIQSEEILGSTVAEAKRSRKWVRFLAVIAAVCLLCAGFFGLGGREYLERQTQSGVMLLTVFENGELLASNAYTVDSALSAQSAENGYLFDTGYGEVRGCVRTGNLEIEYGFLNTNNWHNIQIRLDAENRRDTVWVRQTVIYQTDGGKIDVLVTEHTASNGQKLSVFREGA